MGWGFGSLKNNYEMGCISMMKKYSVRSLVLAFCLCFAIAMPAFAAAGDIAEQGGRNNPLDNDNMVLSDCSNNSFIDEDGNLVDEEIKVYTGKDGWGMTETTQVITEANGIVPYSSGTVTKSKTTEIERFGKKVYRVYIWGQFQYDGEKAIVMDASWNTRILDDSVHVEQAAYGDSGTFFNKTAYIWVNYHLGDGDGTFKGTVELKCDKNGN